MNKSDVFPMPKFFDRYINLVGEVSIIFALESTLNDFDEVLGDLINKADYKYEASKWTVKEVIRHVIDNEYIQLTRALRISRGDKTPLLGYDENQIAMGCDLSLVSVQDLIAEFKSIRKLTINTFKNCNDLMLKEIGHCSEIEISTLGLGFQMVGHQNHHLKIIKEKYLKNKRAPQ